MSGGDVIGCTKAVVKMTKTESQQEPNSISLESTDPSAPSEAVLALGRKLVDELGLEPSVDTLGRWMAHYIAELILELETVEDQTKQSAEKRCFEAILALWSHRAELPTGKRPFRELEPIVRAVESLDPESDIPRYFRSVHASRGKEEPETDVDRWLGLVKGLDYSAKLLIRHFLTAAAQAAVDKSKEWVRLAEEAGAADGVSEIVIRLVSKSSDLDKQPDLNAATRRSLQDRLIRLESFVGAAQGLVRELSEQIQALPATEGPEQEEDNDDTIIVPVRPKPNIG